MSRVLVAMSGGVDSSCSARLLKSKGFDCVGVTMQLTCKEQEDVKQEAKTCGIDHVVLDYCKEFKKSIILRFVKFYELGCTPNPCVWCNKFFKFGKLLDYAVENSFDYLATGHYARVEFSDRRGCFVLKRAIDQIKDQTYFLYFLNQKQLSRILFPVGNFIKTKVKKLAEDYGLKSAQKLESQDICFVEGRRYVDFIRQVSKKAYECGDFVDESGKVLGQHEGIINYTVGQRRGLKLSFNEPLYVKEINFENNEIVLTPRTGLFIKNIVLKKVNLIFISDVKSSIFVTVKLRYSFAEFKAEVCFLNFDDAVVKLEQPQIAPAKGQVVVFYDGELVVGGGTVADCFA